MLRYTSKAASFCAGIRRAVNLGFRTKMACSSRSFSIFSGVAPPYRSNRVIGCPGKNQEQHQLILQKGKLKHEVSFADAKSTK